MNDDQFNLFESRTERDKGMEKAGRKAGDYVLNGLAMIARLPNDTLVTGEDVYRKCLEAKIVPHDAHAHGTLIRMAVERGILRKTGEYRQMRKVSSHARETRLYRVHSVINELPLAPQEPPPTNAYYENGMLIHTCAVCGSAKAPNGEGVSMRNGRLGLWYCELHKP